MDTRNALAAIALLGAALYAARAAAQSNEATAPAPAFDEWQADTLTDWWAPPIPTYEAVPDYAYPIVPGYVETTMPDGLVDPALFDWYAYQNDDTTPVTAPPPHVNIGYQPVMFGGRMNYKVKEYPKYATAIRDAEDRHGIPRDLFARLLYQESGYKPDVIHGIERSRVGALGIAQFMPATAAEMGVDPLDPFAAIDAGARYLKKMYGMFNDWRYALMAYNWGPGNMRKYLRSEGSIPVPMETSQYVAKITADVPVTRA